MSDYRSFMTGLKWGFFAATFVALLVRDKQAAAAFIPIAIFFQHEQHKHPS